MTASRSSRPRAGVGGARHRAARVHYSGRASTALILLVLALGLLPSAQTWASGQSRRETEIGAAPDLAEEKDLPPAGLPEVGWVNGKFVILNMHGLLFQDDLADIEENIAYARWLNAGVIRVFATDANHFADWDGERLGGRIGEMAPLLRAANIKLIVAIVNNHREVPGELAGTADWMDGYHQLLLPFYTERWRGAYLTFMKSMVETVERLNAGDVLFAWELGNELHTPRQPPAVLKFINQASAELRRLAPQARVLAGTMGANHLEPGRMDSPIARTLYCSGPISAYTLHAYDWIDQDRWGDMPIHWDFQNILNRPCLSGRHLPVIVEELGTSRSLPGFYSEDEEELRFEQELNQLRMVLGYQGVVAVGVWSAQSPKVADVARFDYRRGLTSYGSDARGGGSCYHIEPGEPFGARCLLERTLQRLPALD